MTGREHLVIYEKTATGYSAYAPDLPGCVSTGSTLAEIKGTMQSAIRGCLAVMLEFGDPIPQPTTVAELVHV